MGKIEFVRLARSIDGTGKLQDIAINEKQGLLTFMRENVSSTETI